MPGNLRQATDSFPPRDAPQNQGLVRNRSRAADVHRGMTEAGMIHRRALLALLGAAALGAASGCGQRADAAVELVRADQPRTPAGDAATMARTAAAVSSFGTELYRRLVASASAANLVCSPYSVYVALAMTAQGARGETAQEILSALHIGAAGLLADGVNSLDQAVAQRAGISQDGSGHDIVVELASVNSLWGQKGLTWQPPFLEVLARDFGTGMRQVDYRTAPDPARTAINRWVSDQTHHRIPELIGNGLIDNLTRLVLVNALYFKAPWTVPFVPEETRKSPFTRLDGSAVSVDLMRSSVPAGYANGPGWTAVDLRYGKGELAMAVLLPDRGRFAEIERAMDGAWLSRLLADVEYLPGSAMVEVGLPRWTTRTQADLGNALQALGIRTAFTDAADLSGITAAEQLHVSAVVHEGFIAVDENGTEAAAATAVIAVTTGAALDPPTLVADRPFLYVIHDVPTGTPLFVGRVVDPTA